MSQCNRYICLCIYPTCDIAMHICQGLVFHALEKPQRGGGGIELSRRRTFPLWRHPASAAYIQSPWETLSCLRGQVEKGLDNFFALITFKSHSLKLIWIGKIMKVARHTLLCLPPVGLKLEELYLYQSGRPKFTSKYHLEEVAAAEKAFWGRRIL